MEEHVCTYTDTRSSRAKNCPGLFEEGPSMKATNLATKQSSSFESCLEIARIKMSITFMPLSYYCPLSAPRLHTEE